MAKFFGNIGYSESVETSPSVWKEVITESSYYGDFYTNRWCKENGQGTIDDTKVNNKISIIADDKALTSFHLMRWVEWMGIKWKISNIDVQPPRIILTIGGVYNER